MISVRPKNSKVSKMKTKAVHTSSLIPHLSCLKRKTACRFTLIELLIVIAIIAILLRSKWLFFLLFSAFFTFLHFHEKTLNTQIQNVTFCMIAG